FAHHLLTSRIRLTYLILSLYYYVHLTLTSLFFFLFFFNDPAPTEIYTLSLHDALPIWVAELANAAKLAPIVGAFVAGDRRQLGGDRKSTRLNSSHVKISYAVFCLKKKKNKQTNNINHKIQ